MKKLCMYFGCAAVAVIINGCAATTITPNYVSTDPELLRIGGDQPINDEAKVINLGSYCLRVEEKWKTDGQTPDGQTIWSKDSFRAVAPCKE